MSDSDVFVGLTESERYADLEKNGGFPYPKEGAVTFKRPVTEVVP